MKSNGASISEPARKVGGKPRSLQRTIATLRPTMAEDGSSIPIVLGGQVDEQVCRYVDADYWKTDAMEGARLCQRLVGES